MKKSDLTKLIAIGAAVTAAAATTAIVISKHKKHKTMLAEHTKTLTKKQAYITGGGLSAFASALYLVRDCGFTPENIHIFTNGTRNCGNNETGFICRRGKTISIKDSMNFFDLISDVDSLDIPDLTVCDEILNIYRANIYPRSVTLIDPDKNVIDSSKIKILKSHRNAILALMQSKRSQIQSASIFDVMDSDFFLSPFWKLISALYGFTEESSAYEFVNCIANMDNMLSGIIPNDFDRYEEIVNPLKEHLKKIGVDVRENAVVTDIDFENDNADSIHFTDGATRKTFYLNDGDICIMPTDEMADCESFGSFNEPAPKLYSKPFELWEKLAEKHPSFKSPDLFFDEFEGNMSEEFTITLSNKLLPELIDKVTCGALGRNGIIVLDDSNWKMTVCAVPSTYFKDQSEDITVLWGCAMRPNCDGDRSGKTMTECSGAEILYELVSCFNLDEVWDDICETVVNVIPCHRRYGTSYLSPVNSKLEIIPTGIKNFAVSGDFAESDNDTVFSEEYIVSTARTASYKLMKTNRKMFESKPKSFREVKKSLKNLVK